MQIVGLSVWGVVFSLLLLAVPAYFFWRVCPRLLPKAAVSVLRMMAQLAFVGFYLYWMFRLDSLALDVAWLLLMSLVGAWTVCAHARLHRRVMVLPLVVGQVVSVLVVGLYLLLLVFSPAHPFAVRWFVPVVGILLCEVQHVGVVALKEYYGALQCDSQLYDLLLGNGATHAEALMPYVRRTVEKTFVPILTNMALVGIVVYPELAFGQIIGGLSPVTSVAYTLVILIASLAVSVISLVVILFVADRHAFDANGRLRLRYARMAKK